MRWEWNFFALVPNIGIPYCKLKYATSFRCFHSSQRFFTTCMDVRYCQRFFICWDVHMSFLLYPVMNYTYSVVNYINICIYFLKLIILFFLLCWVFVCCILAFSSDEWGLLFVAALKLLIVMPFLLWSTSSRHVGSVVMALGF